MADETLALPAPQEPPAAELITPAVPAAPEKPLSIEDALEQLRMCLIAQRDRKHALEDAVAAQDKAVALVNSINDELAKAVSDTHEMREQFENACERDGLAGHVKD